MVEATPGLGGLFIWLLVPFLPWILGGLVVWIVARWCWSKFNRD